MSFSPLSRDPVLVKKIGAATALEIRATGIPYTFAPCIAVIDFMKFLYNVIMILRILNIANSKWLYGQVCRDPRWGRCYESYSEDPKLVQAMTVFISGLQGDITPKSQKGFPFVSGR